MRSNESSVGGAFPTTVWSNILAAKDPSAPRHRPQMERLLKTYWRPVYAYVRVYWRRSTEDAKDLTQAFFLHILERKTLSRLRPGIGTFRSYLKGALRYFLIDAARAEAARRPPNPVFNLDEGIEEFERVTPVGKEEAPERAYDREWFRCLFQTSVKALEKSLAAEGKEIYFRVFQTYCLEPDSVLREQGSPTAPTYQAVAEQLGIQETDVRNYLVCCRKILWQHLREQIRDYTVTDEEVERELREIVGG